MFAGCDRPLRRDLVTAEHVHGKTGIDGADLPDPTTELQPQSAVDWMIETLLAAGEREITICPVGPMTNIATVLEAAPEAARNIREIVCMGGGFFDGAIPPPPRNSTCSWIPKRLRLCFTAAPQSQCSPST